MAESLHILLGTSACLQWLCHSGERTVARGPPVILRLTDCNKNAKCKFLCPKCTFKGKLVHTCHISHCEIKSHRIWPIWKAIPIKNSDLTEFSDHFTIDFMKK